MTTARRMIALPIVTSNPEFKTDVLVLSPDDVKAIDVIWDKEDQAFELNIHVGPNRQSFEVLSGLTDLMLNLGWDDIDDPYGVLNGIVEAERE